MPRRSYIALAAIAGLLLLTSCPGDEPEYPDFPLIDYTGISLLVGQDALGNPNAIVRIHFDFTDGDGNIGLPEIVDSSFLTGVDTLDNNLFLHLYDYQDGEFVEVPENKGGLVKYRIPYLDKQKLVGTIDFDVSFPVIVYDTIFFTFYIFDRDLQRSNVDSTEIIDLSIIDLDSIRNQ